MKLQAKYFRIGNLLEWQGELACVSQILELELVFKCGDVGFMSDCKPIPLTEEWLLKFGFIKFTTKDIHPTFANKLLNWNDGILYLIGYGYLNHIQYIHQLQNLYHALTNEELTLNK